MRCVCIHSQVHRTYSSAEIWYIGNNHIPEYMHLEANFLILHFNEVLTNKSQKRIFCFLSNKLFTASVAIGCNIKFEMYLYIKYKHKPNNKQNNIITNL